MATHKEVAITQKNHQKGKDVILYNVYRDHASPVAKATILSIDQRKLVGGQALGPEYCDVVVNYVIKRDSILPRGVGNMTTMGQAQGRCIAWPYKHKWTGLWQKYECNPKQAEEIHSIPLFVFSPDKELQCVCLVAEMCWAMHQ